jgi:hypothetical protein
MYPVSGLASGLFTEEDLPDSIEVVGSGGIDGIYERDGTWFRGAGLFSGEDVIVFPWFEQNCWFISLLNPQGEPAFGPFGDYCASCLHDEFQDSGQTSGLRYVDTFKDTYTVKAYDAQGALIITDTYVRESLCVWVGSEAESSLVFIDEPSEGFFYGWVAEIIEFDGFKEGTQNTPVGEYPVPTGQFEGGKLIVSEEE